MRSLALASLCFLALTGCMRRVVVQEELGEEPPPGTVALHAVSDDERVWELQAGNVVCATPCTERVDAASTLLLRSNAGDRLYVPNLLEESLESRRLLLVAEGRHRGKQVNGIVFTTLGGMGVVVGITFTAVGCGDFERRPGTCTAGLITGGVSALLTAGALWMLLDSFPKAHIFPVLKPETTSGKTPVTFAITPGGVAGTF